MNGEKTAVVTGGATGIGAACVRELSGKGFRVGIHYLSSDVAAKALLAQIGDGFLIPADLDRIDQIDAMVERIKGETERVDVLVNNAGIGLVGAFEAAPMAYVRKLFETNTFGTMAMVQAVIPQMRARRSGVIVNVTSSVTLAPMPLAAAYTASKQAIEGFTGSLAHELAAFGVRAKLVEPGYAPTTRFSQNIDFAIEDMIPAAYADFAGPIFAAFANPPMTTTESDVAEAVILAATDGADRLRYPAGPDAVALAAA